MSLKKYITESERATAFPVTGDVLRVVVNEYSENEIAIDFPVVEHTEDSIVFESDEYAYGILEGCNYVGDSTDGKIDPPSEKELDEGMGSKCCKYCGDEIYKPTTDCGYDSQDPDGENWEIIDIDGDGDADIAISNEGYRSITNEGTLMERIKDGKIYCPEACCGTKVMDCTCGAKCPHCNCKQIQKLAGEIKMFEDQATLYKRMGVPSSAEYYTRKLTEAVEQTQRLIEDVEDVEAMITRRIMNHPEFSDMVREYGIEQITQAIADTAEFHGDDDDEIGSSDVSAMVNDTIKSLRRMIEGDGPDEDTINESPRDLKPGDSVMTKDRGMLKIKYIYTKEKDRYDALVLFDPENYKPKVSGGDFQYHTYKLGDPGSDLEYNKEDDSDLLDPEIVAKFRSATMAPGGAGKVVKQLYAKVYQSIEKNGYLVREYLDDNAPMFSQMFEKYEDLDSLVKALDDDTLEKLADELESVADELKIQSRAYVGGWIMPKTLITQGDGPDEEQRDRTKMDEAEYQGRKVKLGKPMQGDVKKFKVYVKDPKTGNVKKVNFGHGGSSVKGKAMSIKKNNPAARKSFRARHNCDNPGPRTKARYWSCRKW